MFGAGAFARFDSWSAVCREKSGVQRGFIASGCETITHFPRTLPLRLTESPGVFGENAP